MSDKTFKCDGSMTWIAEGMLCCHICCNRRFDQELFAKAMQNIKTGPVICGAIRADKVKVAG